MHDGRTHSIQGSTMPPSRTSVPASRRQKRPSSATGATPTREDITPWEFQEPDTPTEHLHIQKFTNMIPPSPTRSSYDAPSSPNRRPKTSSGSLGSLSFLSLKSSVLNRSTSTGPVAEVTPWELYPAPTSALTSTSASFVTASETHTSSLNPKTTNTGPLEQVTPWELDPGPEEEEEEAPGSPSSGNNNKFVSLFKSKPPEPKLLLSKRNSKSKSTLHTSSSPSSPNFAPLPMDLLDAFGTMGGLSTGIPPVALQRSLPRSVSQRSAERSPTDPKHAQSAFKWPRPGSKDRKESFSNGERTRQLPLTGPVEEVAPWEMNPPLKAEVTKKMTLSTGNRALAYDGLPPVSPTIEMWKSQKSAGQGPFVKGASLDSYHYTRSMSSSALPLSTRRARAESVASYMSGERAVASSASLPLRSSRVTKEDDKAVDLLRGQSGRPVSSPASVSGATSIVSTMNKAQMEQVTPWELCPIPTSVQGEDRQTPRTSTSSAAGRAFVELGLKKRRSGTGKTTGPAQAGVEHIAGSGMSDAAGPVPPLPVSGSAKAISNVNLTAAIGQTLLPISILPSSSSSTGSSRGPRRRGTTGKEKGPVSSSSTPTLALTTTTTTTTTVGGSSTSSDGARFSTADRTILEELKANIRAREAQFVIKGVGHTIVGGRKCAGKRYHPHRKSEVPYPRSYDREVIDLDVWETMFWLDLCKGLSWHSFDKPPTKVLEIGCGTGTWILQAATTWKDCHFVGLDIVPLHPTLQNFAKSDVTSRITWVQHNFLDGLPFQNEEFDFVHIKRIALGIPEDKWDKFLEEIQRVMKPGGALEMIEEDLFFPGKPVDDNDHESMTVDADLSPTFSNETLVNGTATTLGHRPMPQIDEQRAVQSFSDTESTREAHNTMGKLRTAQTLFKVDPLGISDSVAPRNPRDHTILDAIWRGMLESRFVNPTPLSLLPTYLEYHFQDVRTHPPLLYSFPPLPEPEVTEAKSSSTSENKTAVTSHPVPIIKAPSVNSFDSVNHHDDGGSRLSTKSSGKHRPLYVAMDETRSDALSPSDLAPSPRKSKGHFATLPDRTLSIDIRTLNLHLALRAKEIVACSEPMWEWVKEFQIRQARRSRFRPDSIEVALLGSTRALNGRDADVLIKDAILEMTRDDFDQVLTNFQLDIQDKAGIKDALERRFDWQTFSSEPLQDRKAFDSACQTYDEWLANETRNQLGGRVGHHGYHHHPGKHDMSAVLPIAKGAAEDLLADLASLGGGAHSLSTVVHSRLPRQLLSCQQLSRAMRVFVAWKESA